ncbi:NfeD family protein [Fodinisporobacter ferrooxydans]|uniref:NfeD family protein n=1 Tax=Fodinisporobacter ferrooxydans TaxID=2901836 RepID=A0ABY4CKG9_9BACL|nr:NfeD family protein [Alicyclobacillaceae bacterium MYW30-H2]
MWMIWLSLSGLFVLLEMHLGTFYMLLLSIAGVCSMFSSLFTGSILIQTVLFCIIAFLEYVFLLPYIRKWRIFSNNEQEAVAITPQDLVNKTGFVVRDILPGSGGLVKIDSELWTAMAEESIPAGSKVIVESVHVTKVIVKPSIE